MERVAEFFGFVSRGFDGQVIGVECRIRNGFPGFDIVGLPDSAVLQSRERVKSALRSSGFKFPQQRVLINLSPAGLPKSGALLDLPIALAILFAEKQKERTLFSGEGTVWIMAAGELTLNGDIVNSPETLGAAHAAYENGCGLCLIPCSPSEGGNAIRKVSTLTEAFLECGRFIENPHGFCDINSPTQKSKSVFGDVFGFESEKEILTLSAAGGHSLLLFGPPGVGKTMLSAKLPLLLPKPGAREEEEISRIYGYAGINRRKEYEVPARMLPHDCTPLQFTSGASVRTAGEGALSHGGVLILDEIAQYGKSLLQAVKQAYDTGYTASSRSGETVRYPARFLMVGNMNPCPCGGLGNEEATCICSMQKIEGHWNKIGRALLERFEIRIPLRIQQDLLSSSPQSPKPDSYYIDKVNAAREIQKKRFETYENVNLNSQIRFDNSALRVFGKEIDMYMRLFGGNNGTRQILNCIAVARTAADCEQRSEVTEEDFLFARELMQYGLGDYYWRKSL